MTNSQEVKEYYNSFNKTVMASYRQAGNIRIDKAFSFLSNYFSENSKILDIGCGIGIIPEKISETLKDGKVWAFDLSEENIKSAISAVKSEKVIFNDVDVINNFEKIREKLGVHRVDLISLVDVVEHLPCGNLERLFSDFASVSTENAVVAMTYPSPEYQQYLIDNEPEKLQIIDESIEIEMLNEAAKAAGFTLTYFCYVDIWRKNQYVHCAFSKDLTVDSNNVSHLRESFLRKAFSKISDRTK